MAASNAPTTPASRNAKGMMKIKEMGLPEGHPEKNGVEVKLADLVKEIEERLERDGVKEAEAERAKISEIIEQVAEVKIEN